MKLIIQKDRKAIPVGTYGTQNENEVTELTLKIPEEYQNWNKRIVFLTSEGNFWDYIQDDTYTIKNNITKFTSVRAYIWLTNDEQDFRTKEFILSFWDNRNADNLIPTEEQIDGFNTLITTLNLEITTVTDLETELNGIITDLQYKLDTDYFKGEKGEDGENGTDGHDGVDGQDGQDAKINGVNTLTIEAGSNINLEQEGNTLTISSTGGGTSNYQDLTNKPSINNVTLTGNKSLNDLGIQAAGNYITNEADPTVPSYVKNITQSNIDSWNNKSDFSGNYNDLTNRPTIPAEVTENTVSGWGFTKNTGTYSKPVNGIPKTDLETSVQTSLEKADTALQSYTEQYTGTITGITMNGTTKGTSGVVDLGTVITGHQDISGKLDTSKVKNALSTTEGDVYDVRYINSVVGSIETLLQEV